MKREFALCWREHGEVERMVSRNEYVIRDLLGIENEKGERDCWIETRIVNDWETLVPLKKKDRAEHTPRR